MNTSKIILLLLCNLSIGCAQNNIKDDLSSDNADKVARDFISALVKLQGHEPRNTMVQISNPKTLFAISLESQLRQAGYGIQYVTQPGGDKYVDFARESFSTSDGTTHAYRLDVGKVSMGREYEVRAGAVYPISALTLRGGIATNTVIDDSQFRRSTPGVVQESELASVTVLDPWTEEDNVPGVKSTGAQTLVEVTPVDKSTVFEVTQLQNPEIPKETTSAAKPQLSVDEYTEIAEESKQNVFDLGHSNFIDLDKTHSDVEITTLVFGYDSLNLGKRNKQLLLRLSQQFQQDTIDKFVIQGCSHGTTKIDKGNSILALGRASRVKDELISIGIPPKDLLTEGCWGPSYINQGDIPPRAVIVTHKRKVAS